ncbi:MAG: hypothetical protein QGG21_00625 [Candidatus Thalassarchaeaceae archaeon]|nr:hypothetical protein [Candidatus Thalassarchaeaceae archaeon]
MVADWLLEAAAEYNRASLEARDSYPAHVLMPVGTLATIIDWSFRSLPDEILVGIDIDTAMPNPVGVDEAFGGAQDGMFAGQGYLMGQPHLVNRGDSYSVHHVPEEWTDGVFGEERGSRGSRFHHFIHSHPNCVAIPSEADAEAAQWSEGCEMILGLRYTPEGTLPWLEDVEGVRRSLTPEDEAGGLPVIGRAVTGHTIHGLELIAFHRSGFGVNLVLTDSEGDPVGWQG